MDLGSGYQNQINSWKIPSAQLRVRGRGVGLSSATDSLPSSLAGCLTSHICSDMHLLEQADAQSHHFPRLRASTTLKPSPSSQHAHLQRLRLSAVPTWSLTTQVVNPSSKSHLISPTDCSSYALKPVRPSAHLVFFC